MLRRRPSPSPSRRSMDTWASSSRTMVAAARTRRAARVCAASPIASRRSAARSRSSARTAKGRRSARACPGSVLEVTTPDAPLPPVARRLAGVRSSPVRDILPLPADRDVVSFAGGMPAPELFDRGPLAEAFAMVLGGAEGARSLQYSTSEGDPRLRAALADLLEARGLATDPDEVLVTTGSQQALTLATAV